MSTVEPLRTAHRRATRDRIVHAVNDLVTEAHPAAISVPAIATRAGVGVATVYRYFPTKEALLDAAAMGAIDEAASLRDAGPQSLDDLSARIHTSWQQLAEQLPLVRNQLASPLGRELRQRRYEAKRVQVSTALAGHGIDPLSAEGRRLLAVLDVLTSSTALLELHDKARIPVDDAAAYIVWAVAALVEATT